MEQQLSIELEITTESILLVHAKGNSIDIGLNQRRMLLYKHDEDMRQEMLAIQFINICDHIFKASGLDLKMKTYKCISVGENKGFIEWVPGAISLSEICKPMGRSSENKADDHKTRVTEPDISTHSAGDDTPTKFVRTGAWCKHESLRSLRQVTKSRGKQKLGLYGNNPIQDFLRSNAYDSDAPYFIRKDVMDNFVKSCAGYCVATYLLGVGDRHTDNLLLDPEGHFLHCDYSFILGQDPKTFLPMRITEHMVNGMGGRDSDNFAKFLSLAGAAFVSLRQPASVRVLMSLVQGMLHSHIPDISITQKPDEALKFIHQRFSLDLDDDDAVAFLEENIENSLTSKIWVAVDTLHSIGKRF
jgi:phosphatidylinositol 3-kinase